MIPVSSPALHVSAETAASAQSRGVSLYRCQMLACNLAGAARQLTQGRSGDIPGEHLDSYLRLRWMRWDRGRLRLTQAGSRACRRAS